MTLSGFSFRPLVFIIPWTYKPVHNHTHIQRALTVLSCLLYAPNRRQTSLCVENWKAQLGIRLQYKKTAKLLFFFLRRQHHPQTHAVLWDCSPSLNFSPPAPCWRAASAESLPTAASGENTFPAPVFLDGGSRFIPQFATFQRETYSANLFQCFFVGLPLSSEVAAENHTSILMRNSEKLKDLSIGV